MSRTTPSLLRLAERLLPVLVAVGGALWALFLYFGHQTEIARQERIEAEKQSRTRLIEAQKPFLTKQLELYFETAQVVGKLVTTAETDPEWVNLERRFWALYCSELSMVEHKVVECAMKNFGDQLALYTSMRRDNPERTQAQATLNDLAYEVAHAIREGIESAWGQEASRPPRSCPAD